MKLASIIREARKAVSDEKLPGSISRDITGVVPGIRKKGVYVTKHHMGLSKSRLRKLGLLPNPYKKEAQSDR